MMNQPPVTDPATRRLTRALLWLGIIGLSLALLTFVLFVLGSAGRIVLIVVGALLLVYLVTPVVKQLRRIMPKHVAVLLTFIGIVVVFFGIAAVVLPPLYNQGQQFASALPGATVRAQSAITDPNNEFFRNLPSAIRDELAQAPERFRALITRYGVALGRQGVSAVFSGLSLLLIFIIIPVLAIYMFFDYAELERGVLGFVPEHERPRAMAIIRDLSGVMGAFVRGQVLDGFCVGSMIFILLIFMHVPFALVIATAAGILNLIPYAGAIAGFIPSVLLALAYNGPQNALFVGIGFAVIQQIDGDFIVPRIMNANVKLSPVVIIISIIGFGSLFGLLGAMLAVPIAAMLRVLKLHFAPSPSLAQLEADREAALPLSQFK